MTDSFDDNWLAVLAGRDVADDTPVAREARALRAALLAQQHVSTADMEESPDMNREQRVRALLARARETGVLPQARRATRLWWGAAAAGMVALAVTVPWLMRAPGESPPVVRTADEDVVRLRAPDPRALKQQLLVELREVGISAAGYEAFGRQGIDAELPQPVPEAVRAVLAKHRIPVPKDSILRIEIEAAAPQ